MAEETREPWEKALNDAPKRKASKADKDDKTPASTRFLWVLVLLMFIIIGAAVAFAWWNRRDPSPASIASHFYNTPVVTKTSSAPAKTSSSSSSTALASSSSAGDSTYTVVAGDTGIIIQTKTGVEWTKIVKLNPGVDASNLSVGQILKLKK